METYSCSRCHGRWKSESMLRDEDNVCIECVIDDENIRDKRRALRNTPNGMKNGDEVSEIQRTKSASGQDGTTQGYENYLERWNNTSERIR